VILFAVLMFVCAGGMWKMKYWAVLGFQALLAIVILTFALVLVRANNVLGVAISLVVVVAGGFLFFRLVRVLSRIQMPSTRAGLSGGARGERNATPARYKNARPRPGRLEPPPQPGRFQQVKGVEALAQLARLGVAQVDAITKAQRVGTRAQQRRLYLPGSLKAIEPQPGREHRHRLAVGPRRA